MSHIYYSISVKSGESPLSVHYLQIYCNKNATFSKYESIGKREFYPTKWGFLYLLTVHMFSSKVNKHKPKQNQKTFLSILSFLQEFFSGEDQRSIFSQVRLKWTLQVRQGFSLWPDPCTLTPVLSIKDWFAVPVGTMFMGTNAVASWGSFECNYF